MGRTGDNKIISLKERRNKKKYKKFYDFIGNLKSALFSKKNSYSPGTTTYKKHAN